MGDATDVGPTPRLEDGAVAQDAPPWAHRPARALPSETGAALPEHRGAVSPGVLAPAQEDGAANRARLDGAAPAPVAAASHRTEVLQRLPQARVRHEMEQAVGTRRSSARGAPRW